MHFSRSTIDLLAWTGATLVVAGAAQAGSIIYVDSGATGQTDVGSNWCNAYLTLDEALDAATSGTEIVIRVAKGTYTPDSTGLDDPREATFQLLNGVTIEGGYAGCGATDQDERDITAHETVLSGDLYADDVYPANGGVNNCCTAHGGPGCDDDSCRIAVGTVDPGCASNWDESCAAAAAELCCNLCSDRRDCDNSYHVVTGSGNDETAVLDGFTITGGNANVVAGVDRFGGGMLIENGSPNVRNCTFKSNDARLGGAVGIHLPESLPTFEDCVFTRNRADEDGGSVYIVVCEGDVDCLGAPGDPCKFMKCTNGQCLSECNIFGDVDHDGDVDLFDLFCLLNGFANDFSVCAHEDVDIEPCEGDQDIDIFDLFAVLNAFAGADPCCSDLPVCNGSPASTAPQSGTIDISLASNPSALSAGNTSEVEVFANNFVDLGGYEVAVVVTGGTAGSLDLEDIRIDESHANFVFAGLNFSNSFDMAGARTMCLLDSGGVASQTQVYLATFVFRASSDASGTFTVAANPGDGTSGTLAADSSGAPKGVQIVSDTQITIEDIPPEPLPLPLP